MATTGVMVCGHGSRDIEAVKEFESLAYALADHFPDHPVEHGSLEFSQPTIQDGLDALREKGVDHILAVPGMLFASGHVKNDVPSILNAYALQHDTISIQFGRELGIDPKLLQTAADRIDTAEANAPNRIPRDETLLMVVGRGTSDTEINGNITKICQMLAADMGFAGGEICYAGTADPLVAPGLEHAVTLGYPRMIVFPYFLFTGVLINRIYSMVDQVAAKFPNVEFLKAQYLGTHSKVIETFADRVRSIADDSLA